jgi:hypothetical protein
MNTESKHQSLGWMLINVLAVLILVSTGWTVLNRLSRCVCRAQPISCVNNEKQLGIAFRGFGIDIGGFPMLLSNTNSTVTAPELVDARPTHFGKP